MLMFHLLVRQLSYLSAMITAASVLLSAQSPVNFYVKIGLIFALLLAVVLIFWDVL